MPLRYKIGDKVRVISGMRHDNTCDGVAFVSSMECYCGKIVTIDDVLSKSYRIKEDNHCWHWVDGFFEDINATFIESNVVLLRNGQIRLIHNSALYLPNGTYIETENYTDRKHNFDENFDIIEVHRKSIGNYLFDLSGELIQEEK